MPLHQSHDGSNAGKDGAQHSSPGTLKHIYTIENPYASRCQQEQDE
jgi:hypothetical protein